MTKPTIPILSSFATRSVSFDFPSAIFAIQSRHSENEITFNPSSRRVATSFLSFQIVSVSAIFAGSRVSIWTPIYNSRLFYCFKYIYNVMVEMQKYNPTSLTLICSGASNRIYHRASKAKWIFWIKFVWHFPVMAISISMSSDNTHLSPHNWFCVRTVQPIFFKSQSRHIKFPLRVYFPPILLRHDINIKWCKSDCAFQAESPGGKEINSPVLGVNLARLPLPTKPPDRKS